MYTYICIYMYVLKKTYYIIKTNAANYLFFAYLCSEIAHIYYEPLFVKALNMRV